MNCTWHNAYTTIDHNIESCPKETTDASGVCNCHRPESCLVTCSNHRHIQVLLYLVRIAEKFTLFCVNSGDPSPPPLLWLPEDGLWPWIVFLQELMNKACWTVNYGPACSYYCHLWVAVHVCVYVGVPKLQRLLHFSITCRLQNSKLNRQMRFSLPSIKCSAAPPARRSRRTFDWRQRKAHLSVELWILNFEKRSKSLKYSFSVILAKVFSSTGDVWILFAKQQLFFYLGKYWKSFG